MHPYEFLWVVIGPCRCIWVLMDFNGTLCVFIVFLCVLMGSYEFL